MNIKIDHLPHCQAVVRVEVPADKVNSARDSITRAFANQAKIPGFRPGKTPRNIIEKRFRKDILEELESRLINEGFNEGVKQEELSVISITGLTDKEFHLDDTFTFTAELLLAPEFELPDYKGITVQVPKIEVTGEQMEEVLENQRQQFATFTDIEDRALQMDDFAVIDYHGSLDGEPLTEAFPQAGAYLAHGQDFWLRMTGDSFLPGYCEALVGMQIGEKREVKLTLPDEFPMKELVGREVVYDVEIKSVKEQELPPLDDDFAGKIEEGKTLDDIRAVVREQLELQQQQRIDELKTNQIIAWLDERLNFDIPNELVHSETQRQINEIVQRSQAQGVDQDELRKHEQDIIGSASGRAKVNVKTGFILDEIADAEDIKATDEEVIAQLQQMAMQFQTPPKKLIKQLEKSNGLSRIRNNIRVSKTLDFLRSNASVEEVDSPPESA